jgi:hypothetical protein
MAHEIGPLTQADLPELNRFLAAGFQAPLEADFVAPEVLRWKYLEPALDTTGEAGQRSTGTFERLAASGETSVDQTLSYVARDERGRIIGHLGVCRTAFEGQALTSSGGRTGTIHIIDWLGSPEHRSVGMSLMRRVHHGVATQFGLGVSQAALLVGERAGYELRSLVPVYSRVLHPGYWLRAGDSSSLRRTLRLVREVTRRLVHHPAIPETTVMLRQVSVFGSEIVQIVQKAKAHVILTHRDPARLNRFLKFPRQAMTGWHLVDDTDQLRGFAVLNLVPHDQGQTRTGKVVDCLLDDVDPARWQAAIFALTKELTHQGADLVQAYAATPWTAKALERCGYVSRFAAKFHIRDRLGLIPQGAMFHLTPLEGDYAYT